ncbi:CaiB/BaiF CoA transferase family protein [Halobacillus litoralis]|uniref:CaiB/BaiF CoA transferase family protein n=1 Tax=Halobacillus litoralis TaxID=45668 RepID=UPI0013682B78|nr:CoA transferase [Halobacillus litoralis]MYL36943.1 CoA transferase [Halobacillus litoralis]
METALKGRRILDLTRVLAGPYCSMILGDLGAEVIKIEAPGGSDETRFWGPPFKNGVSSYFLCANRNKKSLTVNLKKPEGREIIEKLVRTSDVVIHNFKTGTMEKLGLGYDRLKEIHPGLVYCSITGFGETGPYRDRPGYDFIIQAMSGLMSITGDEHSGPQKFGVAITDILTGLYACIGIQAALLEREASGTGQKIDLSLFDSAVSALVNIGSNYLMTGELPSRLGSRHANIVPYQSFSTKDGEIVIAVGNDRQFMKLVSMLGLPSLGLDPKFRTNAARVENRKELSAILQNLFLQEKKSFWENACQKQEIPFGPIQTMEDVRKDQQLKDREMFIRMQHPKAGDTAIIGSPLKLSKTPVSYRSSPPEPGADSASILSEIGYDEDEIQQLKQGEII